MFLDFNISNTNVVITPCEAGSGIGTGTRMLNNDEQECIPVGCVPSAAVAVCWRRGGVCLHGGVCPGGVSAWGGVSAQVVSARGCLTDTPIPPMNRMTDRQV